MAGYIRQDTTGAISTNSIIEADDLNVEFDAVEDAFNASTGHSHDGTSAEGAPIEVLGPSQDVVVTASTLRPKTDNAVDLGTASLEFKDLYIDGTANIDSLVADAGTVGGANITTISNTQTLTNKTVNLTNNTLIATSAQLAASLTDETGTGAVVFSNSPTFTGTPAGPTAAAATNTTQLATTAHVFAERTNTSTLTNKTLTSPDINGGTLDNTVIGGATPAAATFTTVTASGDVSIADKIVHTGDINTAIRFPAADTLTVETAGSERMRVTSTGNVGIGTTTAGSRLTVSRLGGDPVIPTLGGNTIALFHSGVGTASSGSDITLLGGNTSVTSVNFADSNSEYSGRIVYSHSVDAMLFHTSTFERVRVDSTGNVGIGTSGPDVGLHYTGDTPKFRIESTNPLDGSIGTEEIGRIEWEGVRNTNRNVAASIRARQAGTWSTVTPWFSPTALEFYTQDNTGVEVTNPRLSIGSTGNVGIGTITPGSKLSIVGLPTAATGLSAGDIWNDGGTLKIV